MKASQRGVGLLELLIALAIGTLLIAGMVALYIQAARAFQQQHALADMHERGQLAARLLSEELRRAGYWGHTLRPEPGNGSSLLDIPANELLQPVWVGSFAAAKTKKLLPSGAEAPDSTDSDVLMVRYLLHERDQGVAVSENGPRLDWRPGNQQTNDSCSADSDDCKSYYAAVYYLRQVNDPAEDEPVPALYMRLLNSSGTWKSSTEVIRNVEAMSFEWGIDTDNDGAANRYRASADVSNWNTVVSVRLSLIVHSAPMNFHIAPVTLRIAGQQLTFDDRRLHRLFVTTATLRNNRARLQEGAGS